MSLPAYDISVDELRVALSFCNSEIVLKPIQIDVPSKKPDSAPSAPTKTSSTAVAPAAKKAAVDDNDDDFDVFGDDDDADDEPKESRADMLARLKSEAEARAASKEKKQRTLVSVEIKPWDVEQDLMALWRKITTEVTQDGLRWGENCQLMDVAYGIKKICTTFVMGANNSADEVEEKILGMEDEVQSFEVISMSVL
ncbi:hypothetical protein MPSEU_000367900 [Mayamaea pseudoterrestris]|nr:hypothetical protein MPSEU_000367900 [Mayamaea pseudoterrestris]